MEIFTSTPGFVYTERIETKTIVDDTESGLEKTRSEWPTGTINGVTQGCAKRTFRLSYRAISQTELNYINAFFLARVGRKEAFWWQNFNESPVLTVYPSRIIIDADYGSEDTTTLAHYPIIGNSQTIYDDGAALVEGVNYTIDDLTGIITWSSKPAAGSVLTGDYRFYREVRFMDDAVEPDRIAYQRYNLDLTLREIAPRL